MARERYGVHIIKAEDDSKVNQVSHALISNIDEGIAVGGETAIAQPYDTERVLDLFEHSNILRQCIDAYRTNIDGFGHRFEPLFDLDGEDAEDKIAAALFFEAHGERLADEGVSWGELAWPSPEQVKRKLAELRRISLVEVQFLERFFSFCCIDYSFQELRMITRQDRELQGWGAWEITRDKKNRPGRFLYLPAQTVYLCAIDKDHTEFEESYVEFFTPKKRKVKKRFRRFAQVVNGQTVFFKEYRDPRAISSRSGRIYQTVEELKKNDPSDDPATELKFFPIHSARTPYGIPRWIGNILSVMGSRKMEETNYLYFDNKAIPPMALLVSGGRLNKDVVPRIKEYIKENIKGVENFHNILIIEAETPGSNKTPGTRPIIELKPMMDQINKEEMFSKYDDRNQDKVGAGFRLPRLLRGDSRDFNRATAEAALRFAEEQVFQPERDAFDTFINRYILPELGVRFWRFASNSSVTKDPETMTGMVCDLVDNNILVPEEGRELAADIFNKQFRQIKKPWVKQPAKFTLVGIQQEDLAKAVDDADFLDSEIDEVEAARGQGLTKVLRVPPQEFRAWVSPSRKRERRKDGGVDPEASSTGEADLPNRKG